MDRFNLKEDGQSHDSEKKKLASTIVLAGEYAMLNNALSFGAMYTSRFVQPKTMNELTLSATLRPKNWFNVAFSYSPIMAAGKSMGVALSWVRYSWVPTICSSERTHRLLMVLWVSHSRWVRRELLLINGRDIIIRDRKTVLSSRSVLVCL